MFLADCPFSWHKKKEKRKKKKEKKEEKVKGGDGFF